MIGKTLKHYQIIEKIGEGGMARIYLAEDLRLSRKVALKVLPESVAQNPERIARFEREAKAIAALNHPNIVTIYSVEEADGLRFLTMELVDGKSLDELIPDGGMELDEFFGLALPMIDAVAAAHRRGVTHRDIKPDNVMVNSEGVVKLLDLGLAKLDPAKTPGGSGRSSDTLTKEGRAVGTVPYMAPEQLAGRPLDHRVDIFALGVVLYEMLTGARPFVGGSSAELISAILRDTPKPVTAIRASLPNGLSHSIRRCLEKLPGDRFQSAEALRTALDSVAGNRPTRRNSSPGSETVRVKATPPKKLWAQWSIAVAVTVAVALVAGTGVSWLLRERRQPPLSLERASDLTLVVAPTIETGRAKDPALAGRIQAALYSALGSVEGLQIIGGVGPTRDMAVAGADYRLGSTLEWLPTGGVSPARIGFEMHRAADATVIWSESLEITDMATPIAPGQLAMTVRARVGRLLGLEALEVPGLSFAVAMGPAASRPAAEPAEGTVVDPVPRRSTRSTIPPDRAGPGDIQLNMALTSALAEGLISVYADSVQIYRRPFAFTQKKGGVLGRLGLRKRVAGELTDGMLVPADASEIRVYVSLAQEPARQFILTTDLRADGTDRLVVDVRKSKVIEVRLE